VTVRDCSWNRVPPKVESEASCRQAVQPEYGQLEGRKLQLHLFPIFVEDCPQLDRKPSLWSFRLLSASNTKPSIPICPPQLNEVNFFFVFFSAGLLLHKKYRMESNTFLPIWSVVATENNTNIRHFRWATCWSPRSQEKSWNDVTNRTRRRSNLIDFSLDNVSNGGVVCLLWKLTKNRGFNQMKKFLWNLSQSDIKIYSGPKSIFGVIGSLRFK